MHSKFLAVLGLCIAVSILKAVDAAPRRHLSSMNDYDYGRSSKHRHDKYPSNYRRRLEDVKTKVTESSDYDYGHDDYEHKGCGCDEYGSKDYGYNYDYKSYGDDCDDYGDAYYGFNKGYGYYPDYSSYGSGYGYGDDYRFYPDYYSSYGGIYGYGYPSYGYPGYGFPGYFGYESTANADSSAKEFDAATEKDVTKAAANKDTKASSDEAKPKSDPVKGK